MSAWNCWKDTYSTGGHIPPIQIARQVGLSPISVLVTTDIAVGRTTRCGQPLQRRMPPALTFRDPTPLAFEEEDKDWPW
jgi:hypothetical protein